MADTERLTWPVQRRGDFLRIVTSIIIATALIFVVDVITPLGVMVWILYLIPLFLTMYLSWKYAPPLLAGVFIILMAASLFLSPRDIPIEYALIDRVFFALILVIASLFIRDYVKSVEEITSSEERYRSLVEYLPEGVLVCRKREIIYVNPAASRLLGASCGENLARCDIAGMIDPGFQETFRQRLGQAAHGARMDLNGVRLMRADGSTVVVTMTLGTVFWDNDTAVQIVMRTA
jgi:PAS domain S-box-containing protein